MNINAYFQKAAINILFIAQYFTDELGGIIITNYNQLLNLETAIIDISTISLASSASIP